MEIRLPSTLRNTEKATVSKLNGLLNLKETFSHLHKVAVGIILYF